MAREPFQYRPVQELPAVMKQPGMRSTPYAQLVEDAKAQPGQWFELDCDNPNQANGRAQSLRSNHSLEAHARGAVVYFRANNDVEAAQA